MKDLKEILEEVHTYSINGNRRGLSSALRQLSDDRQGYYQQSVAAQLEEEFSDALYKMLLLELDEEEEDSIEIAELAYLTLSIALRRQPFATPGHYKRRLLLLHYFCDYFTDAIIEVFLAKYRQENILQARNLALACLEKMQLSDMFYLEENEPEFINRDEQLAEACNTIETNPNLSEQEKEEALLLHRILYAWLRAKYQSTESGNSHRE